MLISITTSMAKHTQLICILFLFLLHLGASSSTTTSSHVGLSLELIHRDSIFSPSYPGKLTASQWFQRQVEYSKSHIQGLKSSIKGNADVQGMTPRPLVAYSGLLYMAIVGIGTPPLHLYFVLDTGSDLTWTQCFGCNPCFPQVNQIYNPASSSTYDKVLCTDSACQKPYQCYETNCTFDISYLSGADTFGIMASETLTFVSNTNEVLRVYSIVFGCSYVASSTFFLNNMTSGILGMGAGSSSLPNQLMRNNFYSNFSYCLIAAEFAEKMTSILRFGNDIDMLEPVQATSFVHTDPPTFFYLNLLDISVHNVSLNLTKETFALQGDGTGGFVIDSGSAITSLVQEAYEKLRDGIILYLMDFGLKWTKPVDKDYPTDLCYELPDGFSGYPSVTFHMEGADLMVDPKQVFNINQEAKYFCLAMHSDDSLSVLGAFQQANHRFTYDLKNNRLSFSPENCIADII